jgi:putative glutamine amidotransferase
MRKILTVLKTFKITEEPIHPVYGLYQPYLKRFMKHNLLPLIAAPVYSHNMIDTLYDMCDGVYFLGGTDFHPTHYGQKKHEKTVAFDPERDEIELYILKKVLKDKKPFLGICRGMQAMNIASGGTLHQHIPDIFPTENHKTSTNYGRVTDYADVFVDPKSRVFHILGKQKIKVTCIHHQGVDQVGKEFRVAAKSSAGVIEALEHEDPSFFCYGVQFHPELSEQEPMNNLFAAFVKAVGN